MEETNSCLNAEFCLQLSVQSIISISSINRPSRYLPELSVVLQLGAEQWRPTTAQEMEYTKGSSES